MNAYFNWFGLSGTFVLTMLMSTLALVLAIFERTTVRWICFAAMALSSIGDLFLVRFMNLDRIFPNYFVIGAAFFMVAHIMYVLCYGMKLRNIGASYWNGGTIIAGVIGLATVIALCFIGYYTQSTYVLPLILVYDIIITANIATVFSFAWAQRFRSFSAVVAVIGVISFFISDLLIGLEMVSVDYKQGDLIWWFYPIGQILLILGASQKKRVNEAT